MDTAARLQRCKVVTHTRTDVRTELRAARSRLARRWDNQLNLMQQSLKCAEEIL